MGSAWQSNLNDPNLNQFIWLIAVECLQKFRLEISTSSKRLDYGCVLQLGSRLKNAEIQNFGERS